MNVNSGIPATAVNYSTAEKKSSPVKKGAAIGAGTAVIVDTVSIGAGALLAKKAGGSVKEFLKQMIDFSGGKLKFGGSLALGIGLTAAVGAGIGAIVKACQKDK